MKHASSRAVFAYWNERRGSRPAPERADIDPGVIRQALGDTFLLSTDFVDQLRFRLAGTRICALFCREVKGEILTELWAEKSRKAAEDIISIVGDEMAPAVTGLTGHAADGAAAELEMLLLPLVRNGANARVAVLGVLAPTTPVYWIGERPVVEIHLNSVRHLAPELTDQASPRLAPSAGDGELRHGFTVYSGGRGEPSTERSA
jgi:hypothetical protein